MNWAGIPSSLSALFLLYSDDTVRWGCSCQQTEDDISSIFPPSGRNPFLSIADLLHTRWNGNQIQWKHDPPSSESPSLHELVSKLDPWMNIARTFQNFTFYLLLVHTRLNEFQNLFSNFRFILLLETKVRFNCSFLTFLSFSLEKKNIQNYISGNT